MEESIVVIIICFGFMHEPKQVLSVGPCELHTQSMPVSSYKLLHTMDKVLCLTSEALVILKFLVLNVGWHDFLGFVLLRKVPFPNAPEGAIELFPLVKTS